MIVLLVPGRSGSAGDNAVCLVASGDAYVRGYIDGEVSFMCWCC